MASTVFFVAKGSDKLVTPRPAAFQTTTMLRCATITNKYNTIVNHDSLIFPLDISERVPDHNVPSYKLDFIFAQKCAPEQWW